MPKKKDKGELDEAKTVTPEAVEPVKKKRGKKTAITLKDQEVLDALKTAGGVSNISQLYTAFNKTNYANIPAPKLKTLIRIKCQELAKTGKVVLAHPNEKRQYSFELPK